jgi:RNA polymerase sigma-70 factor, ECF subfamily
MDLSLELPLSGRSGSAPSPAPHPAAADGDGATRRAVLAVESARDAELALAERIRAGDLVAFRLVVEKYQDAMVNYLSRLTGSRHTAEDLAQEVFLRFYQKREQYREDGRLGGYLYRMATNLAISEHRRARRRRLLTMAFLFAEEGSDGASPQTRLLESEEQRLVAEAIARLPLAYRVPLCLHEIEGLPLGEVSAVTGLPEGTLKSRLSRGRAQLQKAIARRLKRGAP